MASYLTSLLFSDHASLAVPTRLLSSLSRKANLDDIICIAIRIAVVGTIAAGLRRLITYVSAKIDPAYILKTDTSFLWVMAWIAHDPAAQKQIVDFELSTGEWRQVRKKSRNTLVGEQNATWSVKDIIGQVIPTYHHSIRIKHNGNYLWVTRRMASFARTQYRTVDHIQIKTFAFQGDAIKNFLAAAHQSYFAKENNEVLIFHAKRINPSWQLPVSRPSRPWSSVILPGTMKDNLISDIDKFLSDKETSWYAARGIPHRRGYLFHGDPGSGKTTLATAIASKLHLDVYVVNPAQRGMDDAKLSKLFRDCPAKSIILIEDIDCIFPRNRVTRVSAAVESASIEETESALDVSEDTQGEGNVPATPMVGGSHDLAPSTVTLSGVLNAIDGVSSQDRNYPDRLDPALGRAGRFDVRVPFFPANPDQARDLYLHFYPLEDFASSSTSEKDGFGIASQDDLDELARKFSASIFVGIEGRQGVTVSMAALQAYLLAYKEDPAVAVEKAKEWAGELKPKKGTRT